MPALVCAPWAGAGAGPFQPWASMLDGTAAVYGVRMPGRESRLGEAPHTTFSAMIEELGAELRQLPHAEIALVGICSGALAAFELAHALAPGDGPTVLHLIAVSQDAPRTFDDRRARPSMLEDEMIEQYIPNDLRQEPELVEMLLPILSADVQQLGSYRYAKRRPLDVPITVFRAGGDPLVSRSEAEQWSAESSGLVRIVEVAKADHLFSGAAWRDLGDAISQILSGRA